MTGKDDQHNQGLGDPLAAIFAQARSQTMEPTPEFLGRLLEVAYAEQPLVQVPVAAPVPVAMPVMLRAERRLFGWLRRLAPSAGLATAVMAGFWLGFTQPAALMVPVSSLGEAVGPAGEVVEMVDLIPSLEGWLSEG